MRKVIILSLFLAVGLIMGCAVHNGNPVEVSSSQHKPRKQPRTSRAERNQSVDLSRTPGGRITAKARGKVATIVAKNITDPDSDYTGGTQEECLELAKQHPEATVIWDGDSGSCIFIPAGSKYTPPPRKVTVTYKNARADWVKVKLTNSGTNAEVASLYLTPGKSASRQLPEGTYNEEIWTGSGEHQNPKPRQIYNGLEVNIGSD